MLTSTVRLTVYAVLCCISCVAIMLSSPNKMGIFAIGGLLISAMGLWFELSNNTELEKDK
jgi:hypothetical protein